MITNSQAIKMLKNRIKDSATRYSIITLDTYIGSYKARKNLPPQDFATGKVTTGVEEARYIAQQRQETLEALEEESPEKVLNQLEQKLSDSKERIPEGGLYKLLTYFMKSDELIKRAGQRLETRITSLDHSTNPLKNEHAISNAYNEEISVMRIALHYELQFLR